MGMSNAVIRTSAERQVVSPIELPPIEIPPMEIDDELDHDDFGPSVEACVWALVLLATGWLALRLYLKVRKHRGLWWDDHFLTIVSNVESRTLHTLANTRNRDISTRLDSSLGSFSTAPIPLA